MAVLGLHRCAWAFLVVASGATPWLSCAGLLLPWLLLLRSAGSRMQGFQCLWRVGSIVAAQGPQSLGSLDVAHRLSLWGMRDLPRLGIEPVSFALQGGALTTEPPGKAHNVLLTGNRGWAGCFQNLLEEKIRRKST